jgi:hypothetical protein
MSSSFLKKLQQEQEQQKSKPNYRFYQLDGGSLDAEMKEESDEEGSEEEETKDKIES